jgi:hypothetical protein
MGDCVAQSLLNWHFLKSKTRCGVKLIALECSRCHNNLHWCLGRLGPGFVWPWPTYIIAVKSKDPADTGKTCCLSLRVRNSYTSVISTMWHICARTLFCWCQTCCVVNMSWAPSVETFLSYYVKIYFLHSKPSYHETSCFVKFWELICFLKYT